MVACVSLWILWGKIKSLEVIEMCPNSTTGNDGSTHVKHVILLPEYSMVISNNCLKYVKPKFLSFLLAFESM